MQTTEVYPSRSIGFIAVYGNVPTRRTTTVSTSTTLKYRAYRSFHRRFYKRVSRNRPIKKKKKLYRRLSVRDIAQCRPRVGSINVFSLLFSVRMHVEWLDLKRTWWLLFRISRNVLCILCENFIDVTDWLTENFLEIIVPSYYIISLKKNLFRLIVRRNKLRRYLYRQSSNQIYFNYK